MRRFHRTKAMPWGLVAAVLVAAGMLFLLILRFGEYQEQEFNDKRLRELAEIEQLFERQLNRLSWIIRRTNLDEKEEKESNDCEKSECRGYKEDMITSARIEGGLTSICLTVMRNHCEIVSENTEKQNKSCSPSQPLLDSLKALICQDSEARIGTLSTAEITTETSKGSDKASHTIITSLKLSDPSLYGSHGFSQVSILEKVSGEFETIHTQSQEWDLAKDNYGYGRLSGPLLRTLPASALSVLSRQQSSKLQGSESTRENDSKEAGISTSSGFIDVDIDGGNYRLYFYIGKLANACLGNLTRCLPESESQNSNDIVFVGVVPADTIMAERFSLPPTWALSIVCIFVLLVLAWPWLRVRLMGQSDAITTTEIRLMIFASCSGAALLFIFVLANLDYRTETQRGNQLANQILNNISLSYRTNIESWIRQLDQYRAFLKENIPREYYVALLLSESDLSRLKSTEETGRTTPIKCVRPGEETTGKRVVCSAELLEHLTSSPHLVSPEAMWSMAADGTMTSPSIFFNYREGISLKPLSLSFRHYFQVASKGPLWPVRVHHTSKDTTPFYLQRVFSVGNGALETVISQPFRVYDSSVWAEPIQAQPYGWEAKTKNGEADGTDSGKPLEISAIATGGLVPSMIQPLLPPGFHALIFNRTNGLVLYHTEASRELIENFLDEVGPDNEVLAWLDSEPVSRADACPLEVSYHGRRSCLHTQRLLQGSPLQLVVLYDLAPARKRAFWTGTFSLALSQLVLLITFALTIALLHAFGSRISPLWPQWDKLSAYPLAMVLMLATVPFGIWFSHQWMLYVVQSTLDLSTPGYWPYWNLFFALLTSLITWTGYWWCRLYLLLGAPANQKIEPAIKLALLIFTLLVLALALLLPKGGAGPDNLISGYLAIVSALALLPWEQTSTWQRLNRRMDTSRGIANYRALPFRYNLCLSLFWLILLLPTALQSYGMVQTTLSGVVLQHFYEKLSDRMRLRDRAEEQVYKRQWSSMKASHYPLGHSKIALTESYGGDITERDDHCTGIFGFVCTGLPGRQVQAASAAQHGTPYRGAYHLHWRSLHPSWVSENQGKLVNPWIQDVAQKLTPAFPELAVMDPEQTATTPSGTFPPLTHYGHTLTLSNVSSGGLPWATFTLAALSLWLLYFLMWRSVSLRVFASQLPPNFRQLFEANSYKKHWHKANFVMFIRLHDEFKFGDSRWGKKKKEDAGVLSVDLNRELPWQAKSLTSIWCSGFERLALNRKQRLRALCWLEEQLKSQQTAIALSVEISPLYRFVHPHCYPDIPQTEHADDEEKLRWIQLLQPFIKVHCWTAGGNDIKPNDEQSASNSDQSESHSNPLIDKELSVWPELLQLTSVVNESIDSHKGKLNDWQVVDFIRSHAVRLYEFRWALCTRSERLLLWDIAHHKMVCTAYNPPLEHLIRRGYVRRDPALTLANRSFHRFVLTAETPETIEAWKASYDQGQWVRLRGPLKLLGLALLVVIIYLAQGSLKGLLAILPALLALIPNLTALLRSSKGAVGSE
ncbi:hypothetical protein KUV89_03990 [Marinobacter hydrocarbonoclasticus]|nr:hypothetical protein [Marinobacter nauticus]